MKDAGTQQKGKKLLEVSSSPEGKPTSHASHSPGVRVLVPGDPAASPAGAALQSKVLGRKHTEEEPGFSKSGHMVLPHTRTMFT